MTAAADSPSRDILYIPDLPSTRFYAGALALLSVLQYFVAEAAVIGAWAGQEPYSRRTGYISDLGAVGCGVFDGRDVCSPAHVLMNASFVVQGIGMMVGALLLGYGPAVHCGAAGRPVHAGSGPAGCVADCRGLRAGPHRRRRRRDRPRGAGPGGRRLRAGTRSGPSLYFAAGALALLLLGWLWLRQTPLGWPILACGAGVPRRPHHRRA